MGVIKMNKNILKNKSFKILVLLSCLFSLSSNKISAGLFDLILKNKMAAKVVGFTALAGLVGYGAVKILQVSRERDEISARLKTAEDTVAQLQASEQTTAAQVSAEKTRLQGEIQRLNELLKILTDGIRIIKSKQEEVLGTFKASKEQVQSILHQRSAQVELIRSRIEQFVQKFNSDMLRATEEKAAALEVVRRSQETAAQNVAALEALQQEMAGVVAQRDELARGLTALQAQNEESRKRNEAAIKRQNESIDTPLNPVFLMPRN